MAKDSIMTFDKYIDNPSGGAAVYTNRQMYKDLYKAKFDKILLREGGKVNYTIYRSNDAQDSYYIHMKIPSEVIDKFYYDVVVRLYTKDNALKASVRMRNYKVQFYSNDPAFVYTHAHAFAKNNLFIEDLKPRMTRESLNSVAKVRNPKDNVWYVKSIFFAYLTMEKYNLFTRTILNQNAVKYNARTLMRNITPAAEKVRARQEAGEKLEKEKRKEHEKQVKAAHDALIANSKHSSPVTKITSSVKTVSTTKRTKTTRANKKVGKV